MISKADDPQRCPATSAETTGGRENMVGPGRHPRHVYLFQPRFAALVRADRKHQTIRATRRRMPSLGDIADLREWDGKPYRSAQIKIYEAEITKVRDISIRIDGSIWLNNAVGQRNLFRVADGAAADQFARHDGFHDHAHMLSWFRENHGLPFDGFVTEWDHA